MAGRHNIVGSEADASHARLARGILTGYRPQRPGASWVGNLGWACVGAAVVLFVLTVVQIIRVGAP